MASLCYECKREYDRRWYLAKKGTCADYLLSRKGQRQTRRERNQQAVLKYFADHPCIDCGETDPKVLTFDHRDPSTKVDNVCSMVFHYGLERLFAEIAKCDVRCANCHLRRTADQFMWWRSKING